MTPEAATIFAQEWIDAWNAHDVDRVLAHYAPEIVFLSPIAQARLGDGRVVGVKALGDYWRPALASMPELRFELEQVLVGHECLTILYRNQEQQRVAETVEFGSDGMIVRCSACYG